MEIIPKGILVIPAKAGIQARSCKHRTLDFISRRKNKYGNFYFQTNSNQQAFGLLCFPLFIGLFVYYQIAGQ
jgi:hypothetical protein